MAKNAKNGFFGVATLATLATLKFSKVVYDIKLTLLNNPFLVLGRYLLPSQASPFTGRDREIDVPSHTQTDKLSFIYIDETEMHQHLEAT